MNSSQINRRDFLKGSACAIALVSFPGLVIGQNASRTRLEWQQFKTTPQYSKFYDLVRSMRANTDSSSPGSWQYWVNVHVNNCPHGAPYFLPWHRGYLYSLEQAMQNLLNDTSFALPYWDYYSFPTIPAEFTDPAPDNPLYVQRSGANVYNALSLSPFTSTVVNFPRGTANAFEPLVEARPHSAVHNLIGGQMGTVAGSPGDPIFYLHHVNIDRLWDAWLRSGGKRGPITRNPYNQSNSHSYWAGSFAYAPNLTLARYLTYSPDWLGYGYASNTLPTSLPSRPSLPRSSKFGPGSGFKLVHATAGTGLQQPVIIPPLSGSGFKRVQATAGTGLQQPVIIPPLPPRPPVGSFQAAAARTISATRQSLGGVTGVGLAEASISARLPLAASALQTVLQTVQNAISAALPSQKANTPRSVIVVLDSVQLRGDGAKGGHFYNIYLNLPSSGSNAADELKYFLGSVGPFEIDVASHHGPAILEYPATGALSNLSPSDLQEVTISFERVNGDNPPQGQVIRIGEVRIDVSTDLPWQGSR